MASPQLESLLQLLAAQRLEDQRSVEESRESFEEFAKLFVPAPDVKTEKVDAGGVPAEWVSVPSSDPSIIVLYLHGGGYIIGSTNTHRDEVSRICRASAARALVIDYRLAPEHPFPAAVEDATAAYRWLLAQGIDPARIVIAGDSAGGGLTAATVVALRDAGERMPGAAVMMSAWADLTQSGESMKTKANVDPIIQQEFLDEAAGHYLNGADARDPLASPVYADLSGLPSLLLQVGERETLLDDSTRFAARAKAAGVDVTLEVWDEMIHVWQIFAPMLPEGQQAIDRIGKWVRERLSVPAAAHAER
jgi:epsilon-lactone hydrolase